MSKLQIMLLILLCPIWIPAGLLFLYFVAVLALLGGLMGLLHYAFAGEWD